jgi:hypothetical protein
MSQTNITDRVLHILQTRFPNEFEIAVLTAQNEVLSARVAEAEGGDDAAEDLDPPDE